VAPTGLDGTPVAGHTGFEDRDAASALAALAQARPWQADADGGARRPVASAGRPRHGSALWRDELAVATGCQGNWIVRLPAAAQLTPSRRTRRWNK